MHVTARVNQTLVKDHEDCITLREAYTHDSQARQTRAGTVLLTNVSIAANLRGKVVEVQEKRIKPRKAIATWPKMRYTSQAGTYLDTLTGEPVKRAQAVYMCGPAIHYLP